MSAINTIPRPHEKKKKGDKGRQTEWEESKDDRNYEHSKRVREKVG